MHGIPFVGLWKIADRKCPAVGTEGEGGYVILNHLVSCWPREVANQPATLGIPDIDRFVVTQVYSETPASGQIPAVGAEGDGAYVSRADSELPDHPPFRYTREHQ